MFNTAICAHEMSALLTKGKMQKKAIKGFNVHKCFFFFKQRNFRHIKTYTITS